MKTETTEALRSLLETVEMAIKMGDWKVDGRCDPDMELYRAEVALIDNGYRRDGLTGEEFIYEG